MVRPPWRRLNVSRSPHYTASEQCAAVQLALHTVEMFRIQQCTAAHAGGFVKLFVLPTCTVPTMAAEAPFMAANSAVRDAAEDMPAAVTAAFSK